MKLCPASALWGLAACLLCPVAGLAADAAMNVREGYRTPVVTAPYANQKPTIDGTIDDVEWQGAESVNAMQTTSKRVSPRQTRFWMAWDEDNLYVAMRSPLRPGERIIRNLRDTSRDTNVVFDDSYEIWIDVGSKSPDGQPVFFQYLANFDGGRYDLMHEPAVGNSRLGWTAGWDVRSRITKDSAWEMEVAIPRKSMYREQPFADGQSLSFLVARNFKKPWEQNSFEGTGTFAALDTHTRVVLSKAAPAIHLLRVADPQSQTFGLELAAFSQQPAKLAWRFDSDDGVSKTGTFDLPAGRLTPAPGTSLAFDKPGKGGFRIRVTSADGSKTFLDWASLREFGDLKSLALATPDSDDRIAVNLALNPLGDYLRVTADFIDYARRNEVAHCQVSVRDASGKQLADSQYTIDANDYVRGLIQLPDLPQGEYVAKLRVFAKDGKVLREVETPFSKADPAKKYPWWNTKAGDIEKVIPPWTPVKVEGDTVGVWGRTMTVGTAGLPAQIVSQGQPLLAGPAVLRAKKADGSAAEARGGNKRIVSAQDHRAVAEAAAELDGIDVTSRVTAEFDGMYKVEMTLSPRGKADVAGLQVLLPIAPAVADYVYGKGEGIRYGFDMGFLPRDKTGRIWSSLRVDSQPMVVGSFIPYLWVGNPDVGLAWFADSDKGWVPGDGAPAIELVRGEKSVDMVLNLISAPFSLDAPRTIVFALQASPAKALKGGWRAEPWWCGHTFGWGGGCWVYPDGKGSTIWQSRPNTTNAELCRKRSDEVHKNGGICVPYFEYNTMTDNGEQGYFGEAWKASSGPLWYGKSLTDYIIWNLDQWIKSSQIDGWYLDNVRPVHCDNIEAGRGYRLPDGRVQPEFNMFTMRDFFLRLRAVWHENGRQSHIVNHMTNNMILPWNAPADVGYDGEHHVIYPEMGKDFMDMWSLERMRTAVPDTWGVNINFMNEYQGSWDPKVKRKVMRAYNGAVLLHDALPTGNSASDQDQRDLLAARERFGITADDVTFIGYWKKDSGLSTPTKHVHLAGWSKPGKLLIAVVNWGEKTDAEVKIDLATLGLPSDCRAIDAEVPPGKPAVELRVEGGRLAVPVERHDFRLITIER